MYTMNYYTRYHFNQHLHCLRGQFAVSGRYTAVVLELVSDVLCIVRASVRCVFV